jgi:hypothetical protein
MRMLLSLSMSAVSLFLVDQPSRTLSYSSSSWSHALRYGGPEEMVAKYSDQSN